MEWLQRISLLLLVVCLIEAEDKPFCTQLKPQKTAITKPTIPSQFGVHMELIDVVKNSFTEMTEYYDGPGQRAAVFISENAGKSERYYRYDQQLFMEVSKDIDICIAVPISDGDHMMDFMQKNGSRKMLSPSGALRFSAPGQVENYVGPAVIRGINTDHWHSCLNMQDPKTDLSVDWYFSSADKWDASNDLKQVPVRSYMKGRAYSSPTDFQEIEMYFEYYHYRTGLPKDLTVFDTPLGIVCKNKQHPKNPPQIPRIMSFRLEHVDTQLEIVTYSDEVYDFNNRLTKHVYKSPEFFSYSVNPLTVINDFNTGVSYNIDTKLGNCTIRPISQLPTDVKKVDSRHVRMTNPEEFFQLENHFYQGVRKTRDIDCDVWIGEKMDKSNKTYKVEWYFAKPNMIGDKATTGGALVRYAEYEESQVYPGFYSNIFDFTEDDPDILQFDVSQCYINRGRENFVLIFDLKYVIHINAALNKFKIDLIMSIAVGLSISPLRIQNLLVTPMIEGVIVSFEMLDIAPKIGDVENPIKEKTLAKAASEMHKMLKEKKLDVFLQSYGQMITVNPGEIDMDITKPKHTAVTYGGGSMFGLALAMSVIGMALSAFITFKVKRR